jgi:predicted metal-dependent hydrolase
MCTYSIKLDDNLVDQVRPSFSDDIALQRWLEEQLEYVLRQFYTKERQETLRKAREAIEAMRQQSELNGNSELTLNEINEEIRLSREARKTAV